MAQLHSHGIVWKNRSTHNQNKKRQVSKKERRKEGRKKINKKKKKKRRRKESNYAGKNASIETSLMEKDSYFDAAKTTQKRKKKQLNSNAKQSNAKQSK